MALRSEPLSSKASLAVAPAQDGSSMDVKSAGAGWMSGATRLFNRIVDLVVGLLVPLAIIALMMGISRVFLDLWAVYHSTSISAGFDLLVTDILSMFVVIELLKSIIEYFAVRRIKISFILDAAVVFMLREIMIGAYKHNLGPAEIGALAALLLVLGALRIAAVRFSPEREPAVVGRIGGEA